MLIPIMIFYRKMIKIPMVLRFINPWSVWRNRPIGVFGGIFGEKQISHGTLSEEIRHLRIVMYSLLCLNKNLERNFPNIIFYKASYCFSQN